jgi:RHS repeat-associated protein
LLILLGANGPITALWAQNTGGGVHPFSGRSAIQVASTNSLEPNRQANSGPFTANSFTVTNVSGSRVTGITLTCVSSGPVNCSSLNTNGFPGALNAGQQWTGVVPSYTTGTHGSGAIGVQADVDATGDVSTAWNSVAVVSDPPSITLVVPAGTSARAVVHNRQPIIRATFLPTNGAIVDTSRTVLTWRGDTVSWLARHNRGLIEWEVDSTRWLNVGDSAQAVIQACSVNGACTTSSTWVVLLNDQLPVLGFTGRPLESLGSEFGAPFGPGLSVSGGEVETAFSIPAYVSMGTARSAGLVYSTRQAYPRAIVPVDLEVPWPAGTPDQIKLILSEGATKLDSIVLSSPTCATGAVHRCRAVLQADFNATDFPNPVRKWLTVEARITSGATTVSAADSTEVVVLGRRGSPYGAGWWPAGVAQLAHAGSDELLIAPDGAATVYRGNGDSVYVPSPGNFTALVKTSTGWRLQPRASLAQVRFDTLGRQVASADQNGNRDSVAYSGTTQRITSFIDPVGKTITLAYDGSSRIASFTDPGGRTSTVKVDPSIAMLLSDSISSPAGRPNVTKYSYQTYGTNWSYLLTKRIGVLLDTTIVTYDSTFKRRPVAVRLPRVPDENGTTQTPVISYKAYEGRGFGSLVSLDSVYVELKDPRLNWTRSLLNRWGESRKSWDSLGTLSKATYDPDGFVLSTEGKNGDSSRVYTDYDRYRRVMRTWITRGGNVLRLDSLVYDTNGRVLQHFDSRGQYRLFWYDAAGNMVRTLSPNNDSTLVWYRSDGLVDSTRVPGIVKAIRNVYDATWKNLYQTLGPSGDTVMTNSFDSFGRTYRSDRKLAVQDSAAATIIDYQWRRTESFFNAAGQVDSTRTLRTDDCTGAACNTPSWPALSDTLRTQRVSTVYDRAGRDSLRVTSHGARTLYVYDRIGRLLARHPWTDSLAVMDTMAYDVAGNLKKTVTRRGYTITTDYDSRNRDTLTVVPTVGTILKSYAGPQDQLTRVWMTGYIDSLGGVNPEVRYGYDSRGRLVADTSYTGSTARVTTYTYDSYERPSTMVDPLGTWTTKYETKRGMADTLITPYGDSISYVYDSLQRAIGPTIYNGSLRASTGIKWLVNGTLLADTTLVQSSGGAYVAGGYGRPVTNDTSYLALQPVWKDRHGSGASTDQLADSAMYDGWERLVQWKGTKNITTLVGSESYTFDANGNISQPTGAAVYDKTTDRLISRIEGATTRIFTYSKAGMILKDSLADNTKRWEFGYDALLRLVSVRYNGVVMARYGYDVLGRRIAKRVYSTSSGGTLGYTRFVYHGAAIAFETDSAGTIGLRYTYGLDEDALLVVRDAAGNHYYTVRDKLASIRGLVKQDGTWWLSQRFSPYGVTVQRDTNSAGPSVPLRFSWIGREYDAETGYYYLRARYYSPALRRFVAEDPLGFGAGPNVYAYTDGGPLENSDPNGAEKCNGACGGGSSGEFCKDKSSPLCKAWLSVQVTFSPFNKWLQTKASGILPSWVADHLPVQPVLDASAKASVGPSGMDFHANIEAGAKVRFNVGPLHMNGSYICSTDDDGCSWGGGIQSVDDNAPELNMSGTHDVSVTVPLDESSELSITGDPDAASEGTQMLLNSITRPTDVYNAVVNSEVNESSGLPYEPAFSDGSAAGW